MSSVLVIISVALSQPAPVTPADQAVAAPVEVEFTFKEKAKITDKRHPDYVRCRTESVIGSLAKKRRICMTNEQWSAANLESSKISRQLVEDLQVGMNNNGM